MSYYFFVVFYIISIGTLNAQFVELGGFVGVLSFNGDVNEGGVLTNSDAAFGGFLRYTPNPRIALKLSFIKGFFLKEEQER